MESGALGFYQAFQSTLAEEISSIVSAMKRCNRGTMFLSRLACTFGQG